MKNFLKRLPLLLALFNGISVVTIAQTDAILGNKCVDNFNLYQTYKVNFSSQIVTGFENFRFEVVGGEIVNYINDGIVVKWEIKEWVPELRGGNVIMYADPIDPSNPSPSGGFKEVFNVNIKHFYSAGFLGIQSGKYSYSYQQIPENIVETETPNPAWLLAPTYQCTRTYSYQWQVSSNPLDGFVDITGETNAIYTFSNPLDQTKYFRRKMLGPFDDNEDLEGAFDGTNPNNSLFVYSNVIKIDVVSTLWENINYVREHTLLKASVSNDWKVIDQLPIGDKLQTTNYTDGLSRSIQIVRREEATQQNSNNVWGDIVRFSKYDVYGRQSNEYLPYTTVTEAGKYKTSYLNEQVQYYTSNYNESNCKSEETFDGSPLNLVVNYKLPGTAWSNSSGKLIKYELNDEDDYVKIYSASYVRGSTPILQGEYSENTLFKFKHINENGSEVVEFFTNTGQLTLRKIKLISGTDAYNGWICTYFIYDDHGLLRYEIQPKAVEYLRNHNWLFTGLDGNDVLNELCFQYDYDNRGRVIWKKSPGADPLIMIYDIRDRVVFVQDGNQRNKPQVAQWTATIYDDLDRPVLSSLYNTNASEVTLQQNVENAPGILQVTLTNVGTAPLLITTFLNPLTLLELNDPSIATILNCLIFDSYSYPTVKQFDNSFINNTFYSNSDPSVIPIVKSKRVNNLLTGKITRVLGTNTFLSSTIYYGENGKEIQSHKENIKSGTDVLTLQYHFDNRLLSTSLKHSTNVTGYSNFYIGTKHLFDKIGRLVTIQKQIGGNSLKTIVSNDLDDLGRVKTKHLEPGYFNINSNSNELESLNYSYNFHGKLIGINKEFALKSNSNYSKWNHFFGLYIGFENTDNVFNAQQLTGKVTGMIWNTQGDDAQRRFDYTYDQSGRLTNAFYTEQLHPGDGWSNSLMDFSSTGGNGQIQYDLNGNLLSLINHGMLPGNSPEIMDHLVYNYKANSNMLINVTDMASTNTTNGNLGDFKDGNNNDPDYVYDANGNLIIDLNKNIKTVGSGILYNHLDKPEQITIEGKGVVQIIYNADGEKLKEIFTPESDGIPHNTTFINSFVYESLGTNPDELSLINIEEGQIRIIDPISEGNGLDFILVDGSLIMPNDKKGVFDYFIKDHQQNVRMVITDQIEEVYNTCTMELSRRTFEEQIFGQRNTPSELTLTQSLTPSLWQSSVLGDYVSKLGNSAGHNLGPNTLQKVMAGDRIYAYTQYFHGDGNVNSDPKDLVSSIINTLLYSLSNSAPPLVKDNATNVTNQLNFNSAFLNSVQPAYSDPNAPQAFLTILFFDERFNLIEVADGGLIQQQVDQSVGPQGADIYLQNVKAPRNGYVFVYVSNISDVDVYFDNFRVDVQRSNIIEENHYFPFGLKIASISSKSFNSQSNTYQYQGEYSVFNNETGWNEFHLRNYDAQIGRFIGIDPYDQFASGYVAMDNDPMNSVDPDGGWSIGITGAIIGAAVGVTAPHIIEAITGKDIDNKGLWGIGGAVLGAGLGYAGMESLFGDGNRGFLGHFRAFYLGVLNKEGAINGWALAGKGSGWTYEIPKIWGNVTLPAIKIGNPFQWIAASKEIITETLLASVRLGQIISDPNAIDGYPSYSGNIPLPPNNGNLIVRIDGGTPSGYRLNYSGANPGSNNLKVDVTPNISEIIKDRLESLRQYSQSGINLNNTREKVIRDQVLLNNRTEVRVFERRTHILNYKYLRVFGIFNFRFIRKK